VRRGIAAVAAACALLGVLRAAPARAESSFVPIPEIILDPNEGNTYGIMGVWLFLNEQEEIQYMVAPDVRYNETKGIFPTFRIFGYPTQTRRYKLSVGKSTTKDQEYEGEYLDRGLFEGKGQIYARAGFDEDSTERFYGFGNNSKEFNESNYTAEDFSSDVVPGWWVAQHLMLSYRMQIRRFAISRGQVDGVPFIDAPRFQRNGRTNVTNKGLEPGVYWKHRFGVTYDTRDSIDMPTRGAFTFLYAELADKNLGSATSFTKFGGEARGFIPLRGEKVNPIIALRAVLDYVTGPSDTPFWERSTLGGRRALRGYGSDRFTGFNRSLASAELRTRVYQRKLFGVNAELELAPFLEAGQVFKGVQTNPVGDLHWVYGLGFRGLVRPQIVAFVDVGQGSEGMKVFTGIDYPF
jgi:outer membrane protein assembly factor BamA